MVRAESSKRAASSNGSWSSARSASRSSKLSGHITSTISRSPFAHTSDPLSECRRTRCQPQIRVGRNRDLLCLIQAPLEAPHRDAGPHCERRQAQQGEDDADDLMLHKLALRAPTHRLVIEPEL